MIASSKNNSFISRALEHNTWERIIQFELHYFYMKENDFRITCILAFLSEEIIYIHMYIPIYAYMYVCTYIPSSPTHSYSYG
jgi:hypothetical protein